MVGHSSDLEAWRKCGDNPVVREIVPTVPAPPRCPLLRGPGQSPGEFRVKHLGLGEGQSPPRKGAGTLWVGQAAGTGQASQQWGGSRRKGLGGVPHPGLGGGAGFRVGPPGLSKGRATQ